MSDADGVGSQPFPFSYDPPAVTDVTPANGKTSGGVIITITGNNFGPNGIARSVTVGGEDCPPDVGSVSSHTKISCTLPPGQGNNRSVVVTVDGQVSSESGSFSYDPPSLTDVMPASGRAGGGVLITLMGENFGTQAVASVGGEDCPVAVQTDTRLECTLPPGSGTTADVQVAVSGQTSNTLPFTYVIVASKCDAAKWTAAANHAKCLAGAESKASKKGVAPDAKTVTACDDKFDKSCAKAEANSSDCSQVGTCAAMKHKSKGWDGTIKGNIQ